MTDIPTTTLVCPKCHGVMRSYERNRVVIDQCSDCRGVFLDRGELERLIDAEEQRYGAFAPPPSPASSRDDEPRYDPRDSGGHLRDTKQSKRRRGGILGELFD